MKSSLQLHHEKYFVSLGMRTDGGSFSHGIGEALAHADPHNTFKIYTTWPQEWADHLILGIKMEPRHAEKSRILFKEMGWDFPDIEGLKMNDDLNLLGMTFLDFDKSTYITFRKSSCGNPNLISIDSTDQLNQITCTITLDEMEKVLEKFKIGRSNEFSRKD